MRSSSYMAKHTLEKYLKKNKITKSEFARRIQLDVPNIMAYFRPTYEPKLQTLAKWARALKCKISDLYDEKLDVPELGPRDKKDKKSTKKKS